MSRRRSGCPINLTLETLGDRWSLIVIRDIMFSDRRNFRSLLGASKEGIASNILADRLKRLTDKGLLSRTGDPSHKQKVVYRLTDKAIDLVPLLAVMGAWGLRHTEVAPELAVRAELLEKAGPSFWLAFMDELRCVHLGNEAAMAQGPSPSLQLREAFEQAMAERRIKGA